MQSPNNWSLHSIAGAYMLGLVPHGYYVLKLASMRQISNVSPRDHFTSLKARLPADTWNKLSRARSAHLNALESLPLFAAAMIAGNVAKLPAGDLNTIAAEYIGARMLYTVLYMGVKSEGLSYLRTGVWAWSIGLPLYGLVKAGRALAIVE
ncbi:conserved hypothetical protein [Histoplasma capsulatum G186AR]|uniref:MAPEG family protein n=2 Tax=Ajellomyces capsulatus TaxID=5037 RepID=C0NB68_AJECG|nr:uncharacterized protein HCBG_00364 [Histoplasma capsulatum G186AR]EEH10909.1 conserved hypothetical protein [Histoplasma capsulatum G186AR]KAG5288779.1 MAPEG superfamily domain-containing protein, predicted membrane protein [Histoplasma capsulatum]KAG5289880.1 MAPEG superfamily domain-containing protein, predicted membrane protein [Histoplasma ohiense (nom. inval.)]QSS71356.1 MAPEG superfamily domain-containing protein, predicted membrane protein [Histoplasma capsulatum G186AR]